MSIFYLNTETFNNSNDHSHSQINDYRLPKPITGH